ncbi:uncharacterized protein LTR77_002112 [Saxophila tyrrhenica]|uniref:Zn(2)-C6 fungal-type domain-containing protein n=1 Tax=Saxophila tyrrhenica TaxID=1690608 RepID=A0AAV9PMH1_9PEZI|nr:hypothetical protein LTR77_002112 [Saxophila tyrrhenica]
MDTIPAADTVQTLPATESADQEYARKKPSKRESLTRNACADCRRSKCKCDGERPVCARCAKRNTDCVYDVPDDGITKMQLLAQQLKSVDHQHQPLVNLFEALTSLPKPQADALLVRIRSGEELVDITASLKQNAPSAAGESTTDPSLSEPPLRPPPPARDLRDWFPSAEPGGAEWSSWSQRCESSEQKQPQPAGVGFDDARQTPQAN